METILRIRDGHNAANHAAVKERSHRREQAPGQIRHLAVGRLYYDDMTDEVILLDAVRSKMSEAGF